MFCTNLTVKEATEKLAEREMAIRRVRSFVEKQALTLPGAGAIGSALGNIASRASGLKLNDIVNWAKTQPGLAGGLAGAGGGALLGLGSEFMRDPEDRKWSRGLLGGALAGGALGGGAGAIYGNWAPATESKLPPTVELDAKIREVKQQIADRNKAPTGSGSTTYAQDDLARIERNMDKEKLRKPIRDAAVSGLTSEPAINAYIGAGAGAGVQGYRNYRENYANPAEAMRAGARLGNEGIKPNFETTTPTTPTTSAPSPILGPNGQPIHPPLPPQSSPKPKRNPLPSNMTAEEFGKYNTRARLNADPGYAKTTYRNARKGIADPTQPLSIQELLDLHSAGKTHIINERANLASKQKRNQIHSKTKGMVTGGLLSLLPTLIQYVAQKETTPEDYLGALQARQTELATPAHR